MQIYIPLLLPTLNVPLQIGKCTCRGTCTPGWEPLVQEHANFWGCEGFFPNFPELARKFLAHFMCEYFLIKTVLDAIYSNQSTLSATSSNQKTFGVIFARIFKEFAQIFRYFGKVFTDFPGLSGIYPDFPQINECAPFFVRCAPCICKK